VSQVQQSQKTGFLIWSHRARGSAGRERLTRSVCPRVMDYV
jgi:hypothetical protein